MDIILVLMEIKEFQGLSLIHSWREAIKDFLYTKYLACQKKLSMCQCGSWNPSVCEREDGVAKHSESQLSGSVTDG